MTQSRLQPSVGLSTCNSFGYASRVERRFGLLVTCFWLAGCAVPGTTGQEAAAGFSSAPVVAQSVQSAQATGSSQVDIDNRMIEESDARRRARIRMELGIGHFQEGRFAVALDELKQALTIDPTFADAIGVLALVYMELGEIRLAEQSFSRAMTLKPNDSDLNVNFGWFLCSTGRERQAFDYFMRATRNPLYTQPALPWQNAGVCAFRIKDIAAAERYFARSFELDPGGVIAALGLARIYLDRGEFERARFYVANVNRGPAAHPSSLWLGLKIERRLGNHVDEANLASRLERSFPNSPEASALARGAYDE